MYNVLQRITARKNSFKFNLIEKNVPWVGQGLQEELKTWNCDPLGVPSPILINAPTGSGKSTFILNDLAQYAKSQKLSVLLLSNRSALELQQKISYSQFNNIPLFGAKSYHNIHIFDNILILTYQEVRNALPILYQRASFDPVGFVVFDEAHFFTSDSTFNSCTFEILRSLIKTYQFHPRIYLTATPEDVRHIIALYEGEAYQAICQDNSNPSFLRALAARIPAIQEYHFPRDNSYIDLHFFNGWEDLIPEINNTDPSIKWLIFNDNKQENAELKKQIADAECIDASQNTGQNKILQQLASAQCFEARVLISTSLLDNGISVCDHALQRIVITSPDEVQIKQMIGRKRRINDERLTVYILNQTRKTIQQHIASMEDLQTTWTSYARNPQQFRNNNWGTLSETAQRLLPPFIDQPPNELALFQINRQLSRYQNILGLFTRYGDQAYADEVCRWLELPNSYTIATLQEKKDAMKREILKVLEPYLELASDKDQILALEQQLRTITSSLQATMKYPASDSDNKLFKNTINTILKFFDIPYECKKKENAFSFISV